MASTADFKNGMCIEFNHDIMQIVEFQHVKPGKGAAFVRTKLKSLTNGRVLENTFPSGTRVNTARVETKEFQFLYRDDMGCHFMDTETYEQTTIDEKLINSPQFLMDGTVCLAQYHSEKDVILGCELPHHVVMKVTYTEPGFKGDTSSSNVTKPATVECGATVNVPLFVNADEMIKIDTRDGSYVERVK